MLRRIYMPEGYSGYPPAGLGCGSRMIPTASHHPCEDTPDRFDLGSVDILDITMFHSRQASKYLEGLRSPRARINHAACTHNGWYIMVRVCDTLWLKSVCVLIPDEVRSHVLLHYEGPPNHVRRVSGHPKRRAVFPLHIAV